MSRPLTLLLLACALFLRVWVPAGWMPAEGAALFAVEPCPSAEALPVMHSMADSSPSMAHHGLPHKNQHDGECACAPLHAGFAPAEDLPSIIAPILAAAPLPEKAPTPFFATGPPTTLPPATGPPSII